MNEIETAVKLLVAKAAETDDPNEAMKYSQAALNAANAGITLANTPAADD